MKHILKKNTKKGMFSIGAHSGNDFKMDLTGLRVAEQAPSYMKKIAEDEKFLLETYDVKTFLHEVNQYFEALQHIEDLTSHLSFVEKPSLYAGLSYITVTHSFLREFGAYTLSRDSGMESKVYNDTFMGFVGERWNQRVLPVDKVKPTYPRGKNTGAPVIISGKNRLLNDIIMTVNAVISEVCWKYFVKGEYDTFKHSVDLINSIITNNFGPPQYIVFSRYQMVSCEKNIPKFVNGLGFISTNGIEPRRRIINSTVKPFAMINKHVIKIMTDCDLKSPEFEMDVSAITQRIRDCKGPIIAMDQSRFDLRHGGEKLRVMLYQMAKQMCKYYFKTEKIEAINALYHALSMESFMDTFLTDGGNIYIGEGKYAIKSGDSKTSRLDSYMSLCEDMYVTMISLGMNETQTVEYYRRHRPTCILGDDVVKFFPSAEDADKYIRVLPDFTSKFGTATEVERPTMFLGRLIDKRRKNPYFVRPGHLFLRYCFPERKKNPVAVPFQIVARMDLIKESGFGDTAAIKFGQALCEHNKYIVSNDIKKRGDILMAAQFWKKKGYDITRLSDVRRAYDALLKKPTEFGLDNVYSLIDEILHTFGRGLEHYVDLSLIGLPDALKSLQHVAYPEFEALLEAIADEGKVTRDLPQAQVLEDLKNKVIEMAKTGRLELLNDVYSVIKLNVSNLGLVFRGENDYINEKVSARARHMQRIKKIERQMRLRHS